MRRIFGRAANDIPDSVRLDYEQRANRLLAIVQILLCPFAVAGYLICLGDEDYPAFYIFFFCTNLLLLGIEYILWQLLKKHGRTAVMKYVLLFNLSLLFSAVCSFADLYAAVLLSAPLLFSCMYEDMRVTAYGVALSFAGALLSAYFFCTLQLDYDLNSVLLKEGAAVVLTNPLEDAVLDYIDTDLVLSRYFSNRMPNTLTCLAVVSLIALFVTYMGRRLMHSFIEARVKETEGRKELDIAAQIQSGLLQQDFHLDESADIFAMNRPARLVGGDLYDIFRVSGHTLLFVIGDVSGKGVPAALTMTSVMTCIRDFADMGLGVKDILYRVNNRLAAGNEECVFVTVWLGLLDTSSGRLTYCSAGHNSPVLKTAAGTQYLDGAAGVVLGAFEDSEYKEETLFFRPGDTLLLYTDGITEARTADGELFGTARLLSLMAKLQSPTAKEYAEKIDAAVQAFIGEATQYDDITLTVLRYLGRPERHAVFPAAYEAYPQAAAFIKEALRDYPRMQSVLLIFEEQFANIASYAYPGSKGEAAVSLRYGTAGVTLTVSDTGIPFNPLDAPEIDTSLSLEERPVGGLGIHLVKQMADELTYRYADGKNILTAVFRDA